MVNGKFIKGMECGSIFNPVQIASCGQLQRVLQGATKNLGFAYKQARKQVSTSKFGKAPVMPFMHIGVHTAVP